MFENSRWVPVLKFGFDGSERNCPPKATSESLRPNTVSCENVPTIELGNVASVVCGTG